MQYSPDGFENFLRNKLDEVKPDPSLQDQLWADFEKMQQQKKPRGGNKWFTGLGLVIVAVAVYFIASKENPGPAGKDMDTASSVNTTTTTVSPIIDTISAETPVTGASAGLVEENDMDNATAANNPLQPENSSAGFNAGGEQVVLPAGTTTGSVEQDALVPGSTITGDRTITPPANVQLPPAQLVTTQPVVSDTSKKPATPSKSVKKKTPVNIIW